MLGSQMQKKRDANVPFGSAGILQGLRLALDQHQIIGMNDGVAARKAKGGFDVGRCMAHQKPGFFRTIGCDAARNLCPIRPEHPHSIPMLEPAIDAGYSRRQKVLARRQGLGRPGIDNDGP